jgi:outer membrane immunogenic protein
VKHLLLAGTALLLCGQAFARDLPPRSREKPAAVTPIRAYSWTGCYVGGHAGLGWGRSRVSDPDGIYIAPIGSGINVDQNSAFLGGVQAGCDYQFANHWVAGVSGDLSWANIDGQAVDPFFAGKFGDPITVAAKTKRLATATVQIGYAWDRWMVYAKGGPAWSKQQFAVRNLEFFGNPTDSCGDLIANQIPCMPVGSTNRSGWVAGFGAKWAFTGNWVGGIEYNHYDFGSFNVTVLDPNGTQGAVSGPIRVNQRIDAVKFTIDYRFGWPGR